MNQNLSDFNLSNYIKSVVPLLENEAIFLIKEAAQTQDRLGLIFNGGRDSLVMAHLVAKAFPRKEKEVTLIYLDSGYSFPEIEKLWKESATRYSLPCLKINLADSQKSDTNDQQRLSLQREMLNAAIQELGFDGIYTAARRQDRHQQLISVHEDAETLKIWDPLPERWQPYQTRFVHEHHHRMYPIVNWSEAEVLAYLENQQLKLPAIYLAHERVVVSRENQLIDLENGINTLLPGELPREISVRASALGDPLNTGFIPSEATTIKGLIKELASHWGERRLPAAIDSPRFHFRFS